MASFYKRKLKDGEVWYVNLILADGRRKSINTKCETKAAAKEVAAEFQRKILLGLDPTRPEPPKQNVIALFERFMEESQRDWSPDTIDQYEDTLETLRAVVGEIPLTDLSRRHRNAMVDYLNERGAVHKSRTGQIRRVREISGHTINRNIRNVTRFLNWCIEEEVVRGWQPPRFKQIAVVDEPKESFTPDEISRILDAAANITLNGQPVQAYLAFQAFSGFRRNEGRHLQWEDVDFERQTILVPVGKVTKRLGRREIVPLTAPLELILQSLPRRATGPVFPGISEKITHVFKQVCEAAGVTYRPLHRLRATFTTQLSDLRLPPMAVQKIVRHKSLNTTYGHYYLPEANALREAANEALKDSPFATAILRIFDK